MGLRVFAVGKKKQFALIYDWFELSSVVVGI